MQKVVWTYGFKSLCRKAQEVFLFEKLFCVQLFQCGINVHLISAVKAAHTAWVQLCSSQSVFLHPKKKVQITTLSGEALINDGNTFISLLCDYYSLLSFVSCPEAYCFSIHCNFQYRLRHTHYCKDSRVSVSHRKWEVVGFSLRCLYL